MVNSSAFTQSGGTHTIGTYLWIASAAPSGGYTLSGSGFLFTNNQESVGIGGSNGTFTQTGGTHSVNCMDFYIGYNASGSYNLSNSGLLSAWANESLGYYTGGGTLGSGNFNQTGGTHTVGGSLMVGDGSRHGQLLPQRLGAVVGGK